MSLPRFYFEENLPSSGEAFVPLSSHEIKHIHALRITEGEHIAVFNAEGLSWELEVIKVNKNGINGHIIQKIKTHSMPHVTLVQGISKGERMTQTIRQTTELGIERIVPFLSQRCIVRIPKDQRTKKGERFRSIALSAAKQSGRNFLPHIDDPLQMEELCQLLQDYDCIVLAWEEENERGLDIREALMHCSRENKVALIIGPEGGFDRQEIEIIRNNVGEKLKIISLGDLILRTETAAVVASTLTIHELGGLGAR